MNKFLTLACICISLCSTAVADTISLSHVETGWFTDSGFNFNGTDNVVVTDRTSTIAGRGFMTFDLSGITSEITAASLTVTVDAYPNSTLQMDVRLYDFTSGVDSSLGNSINSAPGVAIYNDLGDGSTYTNTLTFNRFTAGQMIGDEVTIALNQNAIDDLNATGGLFTIGFSDVGNDDSDDTIRFRSDNGFEGSPLYQNQLILDVASVPEPRAFAGCCAMILICGMGIHKRRRRALNGISC